VNTILDSLRKKGFRNTFIRKAILEILSESKEPLTYEDFKKKIKANKSTVYRELSFLGAQGIIKELHFNGGAARYEMTLRDHHHHIVCVECNTIDHVEIKEDLKREEERISKNKKFKILQHTLDFYGLCAQCQ